MKQLLSRHATTIALVCAAVGAGVWFYVDRGSITTSEAERRRGNLFPVWRSDELVRVEITGSSGKTTLLREADGSGGKQWSLALGERRTKGDALAIDRLLGTLEYATVKRRVAEESIDRPAFGLDAPHTTIAVDMGAQGFELRIGSDASAPEGSYVELVGHGVYVVSKELGAALARASTELRARELVPMLSVSMRALRLSSDGGAVELERAPWSGGRGSGFRFAKSAGELAGVRVDGDRLDQVFAAFGRMQAEPFLLPEEAAKASAPVVRLELVPIEGETAVLQVGGECPGQPNRVVVVREAPDRLAGCVPQNVLAPLTRRAEELEDRGLLGASVDEIAELVVEEGTEKLELARKESAFVLKQPEQREIPAELGSGFLEGLVGLHGKRLPDAPPPSFAASESITLRVRATGGMNPDGSTAEREEKLVFGPVERHEGAPPSRRVYRVEDGRWLEIPEAAARAVSSARLLLRERRLLDAAPESFRELGIVDGKRRQRVKLGDDGQPSAWLEPTVRGLGADDFMVREVTRRLSQLEVVRWVAPEDDGSFGLEPPRIVVSALVAGSDGAEQRVVLRLGALTDEGPYARFGDRPEVFIAPKELERSVGRWLLDTSSFVPPLAEIDRLEAKLGARSLLLERDGPKLVVRLDGQPAGESVTSELRDAVASMRPMGVVSVGSALPAQGLDAPLLRVLVTPRVKSSGPGAPIPSEPIRIEVGAGDTYQGISVHYARRSDVDATFAVPQAGFRTLLELLSD